MAAVNFYSSAVSIALLSVALFYVFSIDFEFLTSVYFAISFLIVVGWFKYCVVSNSYRPVLLVAVIYFLSFYLFPALVHLNIGYFPFYSMAYRECEVNDAALVLLVTLGSISLGYFYGVSKESSSVSVIKLHSYSYIKMEYMIFALLFMSGCGVFGVGFDYIQTSRGDRADIFVALNPMELICITVARVCSFLAFVYSVIVFLGFKKNRSVFVLITAFVVFLMVNNPTSTPRYIVASYAFCIYFLFFGFGHLRRIIFLLAVLVSQITIFPIVSEISRGDVLAFFEKGFVDYYSSSGDFDGFQSTINAVQYINSEGYQLGRSLGSAVLFFVPRSIWPEKSIGLGGESAEFIGYPFLNVSSPLPAELYADFGFMSVFLVGFVIGYLWNKCDLYYTYAKSTGLEGVDKFVMLLPTTIFVGYLMILLRGSLVGVLGPFFLSMMIVVIVARLIRK